MGISAITLEFLGRYTIHASLSGVGEAQPFAVSQNLDIPGVAHPDLVKMEELWIPRFGFVKGTPGTKDGVTLMQEGLIDTISMVDNYASAGDLANSKIVLAAGCQFSKITYVPSNPAGQRLQIKFFMSANTDGGAKPIECLFTLDISHSINR